MFFDSRCILCYLQQQQHCCYFSYYTFGCVCVCLASCSLRLPFRPTALHYRPTPSPVIGATSFCLTLPYVPALLDGIAVLAIPPIATRVTVAWSVRLYKSVTHKAVGRNEMPFGRHTDLIPSNSIRGAPVRRGTPSSQRCHLLPNYFSS